MEKPIEEVELLQALIRFDTANPPGNEQACVEFIGRLLEQAGIEPRYVALDPGRPNLVARIPGRGAAPPLLLYGHVDVVPADAREWTHPPFGGDLIEGEVWGRGALDMKTGVAMLASTVMRAASAETPPPGDLILALTSDEEAGSHFGMKYLVENHAELFDGVRYALSEFGGFTLWRGDRRFVPIQVAEKQRCVIRATVHGRGGHPAAVVRGTASERLGALLSRLATGRLPIHVTPVARLMLESVARNLPRHEGLAVRSLLVPRVAKPLMRVLGGVDEVVGPILCNTAMPTGIEGVETSNVIPTELSVELDGRVLPGLTPDGMVAELRAAAGRYASFDVVSVEPAVPAEPDLSLMPLLSAVMAEHDPGCVPFPMLLPGYTDARYVSKLGIQTYGFLPMRLPRSVSPSLVHSADERVPAPAVEFGTRCLLTAVERYR